MLKSSNLLGISLPICIIAAGCGVQPSKAPVRVANADSRVERPFLPGSADPARKAKLVAVEGKLDDYFRAKVEQSGSTGLAVGLLLDGELIYSRGFGVRDRVTKAKVDGNTVFRIASLTKNITALAVMKLRDEGRIDLDAPASKYYPPLTSLPLPTSDSPQITARLLLTNASGLAYDDLWGAETYGKSDQEFLELLRRGLSFSSVPGTSYAYSNLGWALLGKVIEGASGRKFGDYVTSAILRPLGMNSTVFEPSAVPTSRMARSYHKVGEQQVEDERIPQGVFQPGGGLYTSLDDYARYIAYNLSAYPPRNDSESGPVHRSTLREMHEGQRRLRFVDKNAPIAQQTEQGILLRAADYGFGWANVASCGNEVLVRHSGYEPSYFGQVALVPSQRVAIITFATSAPLGPGVSESAFDILRTAGVLDVAAPRLHPALVAAGAKVRQLLSHWDEAVARAVLDQDGLRYWWNAHLRVEFEKLRSDHGHCHLDGVPKAYGPLHADFRMVCDTGAVVFDLLMTPSVPPTIQAVDWTEEFVVDEVSAKAANRIASLIAHWDDTLAVETFASAVEQRGAKRRLARAAVDYGTCTLGKGTFERERDAWFHNPGHSRFELTCEERLLALSFKLDSMGKVVEFSLNPPRQPEANCWQ